ncbi:MAG: VOC family protein [Deltaproteobacteria bacterium]|nr:VOC family protein [Deltaproteobacteria bacterium]
MNQNKISAIHHITAIAASAAENLEFYEQVLGLRLVKQTVNFDDPYTYHLYYGDGAGFPGTIMTFFSWEGAPSGSPGSGMIDAISFSAPIQSMWYWYERLAGKGIEVQRDLRFDEPVLRFKDPHRLSLELIGVSSIPSSHPWQESSVEASHGLLGFHSATALLNSLEDTQVLLAGIMGMQLHGNERNRYRFKMRESQSPGHFFDVLVDPRADRGRLGAGTVHHIAFRSKTDEEQLNWRKRLIQEKFQVTEIIDRKYFRSIYFREPGGVLFEIATDPPGFTVDEPLEKLGGSLKLPSQYEPIRSKIVKVLPPLRAPEFQHEFWRPEKTLDDGQTIVPLHGTGGNEKDLVGVSRRISASSAIISPRGKVIENGQARFFRRLAEGVFDERDVVRRAHELADFLAGATSRYGRCQEKLVALGYSNGANIAAAILLLRAEVFSKAVLLRPMMPLLHPPETDLSGKRILILDGRYDTVIPKESTDKLRLSLEKAGATVESVSIDTGHEITTNDIALASEWLSKDSELRLKKAVG